MEFTNLIMALDGSFSNIFDLINLIYKCVIIIDEVIITYNLDIMGVSVFGIYFMAGRAGKACDYVVKGKSAAAGIATIADAVSKAGKSGTTGGTTGVLQVVTVLQKIQPVNFQPQLRLVLVLLKKMIKILIFIKVKFNNLILSIKNKFFKSYLTESNSFIFPLILSQLNLSNSADQPIIPVITSYYLAVFILSLISLLSFINVLGYFLSIYLLSKYDIEKKYPKLKRIIKYYEKVGLFWVIVESLMGITLLIFLTGSALILYIYN